MQRLCGACSQPLREGEAECPRCGWRSRGQRFKDWWQARGDEWRDRQIVKAKLTAAEMMCPVCGGHRVKKKRAPSMGVGCALFVLGLILCATFYGIVIGIPAIVMGLVLANRREGYWWCEGCGKQFPRKIKSFERAE
jgi:hypothetical protein